MVKYTYIFKNKEDHWRFDNVNYLCDFINLNFHIKISKNTIYNYYENKIKNPHEIYEYISRVRRD